MRLLKSLSLCLLLALGYWPAHAQYVQPFQFKDNSAPGQFNVGGGRLKGTHPSAYLEVGDSAGSKKGFLPPRGYKDSVQQPAKGLHLFDVATNKPWWFDGTRWVYGRPYTFLTPYFMNSNDSVRIDTLSLATRARLKHYTDSAIAVKPDFYSANGSLSSNRDVTLGARSLQFLKGSAYLGVYGSPSYPSFNAYMDDNDGSSSEIYQSPGYLNLSAMSGNVYQSASVEFTSNPTYQKLQLKATRSNVTPSLVMQADGTNPLVYLSNTNSVYGGAKITVDTGGIFLGTNPMGGSTERRGIKIDAAHRVTVEGPATFAQVPLTGDTAAFKPFAINAQGEVKKLDAWPGAGSGLPPNAAFDNLAVNNSTTLNGDTYINGSINSENGSLGIYAAGSMYLSAVGGYHFTTYDNNYQPYEATLPVKSGTIALQGYVDSSVHAITNFAQSNLTATDNRIHDFNGYELRIQNMAQLQLKTHTAGGQEASLMFDPAVMQFYQTAGGYKFQNMQGVSDTAAYKPFVVNAQGDVKKFTSWPPPAYKPTYFTNASLSVPAGAGTIRLGSIVAPQTLTLPTPATAEIGRELTVWNNNANTAYTWSVSGAVIRPDGTSVSAIPNGKCWIMQLIDNTTWLIKSEY